MGMKSKFMFPEKVSKFVCISIEVTRDGFHRQDKIALSYFIRDGADAGGFGHCLPLFEKASSGQGGGVLPFRIFHRKGDDKILLAGGRERNHHIVLW